VRVITLDAANWKTIDDFYCALLEALGAPDWHGHNLDALAETIFDGGVNAIDPPFRIHISSAAKLNMELRAHLRRLRKVFKEESAETGVEVELSTNVSIDD
jgi:RNAse (barnase) inhibitor barstar